MMRGLIRKFSRCLVREYAISKFVMTVAYIAVSPYGRALTTEVSRQQLGSNLVRGERLLAHSPKLKSSRTTQGPSYEHESA